MKRFLFAALLMMGFAQAQDLKIVYELTPGQLNLYLRGVGHTEAVRAVNFSLAMPAACTAGTVKYNMFQDVWTNMLEEAKGQKISGLSYNGQSFGYRWQYGNADPGLPHTAPIAVPAEQEILVMQVAIDQGCIAALRLEHERENPLAQIGNVVMEPMPYEIELRNLLPDPTAGWGINVSPNPVRNQTIASFNGNATGNYDLKLYDLNGKQLQAFRSEDGAPVTLDMSRLAQGVYLLETRRQGASNEKPQSIRIIRQ